MIRVGQRLEEERVKKRLTLKEVSSATKIRVEFLQALERGDYKRLPSASYAQGFVRNYAKFLEMPEEETLALFRREFDEKKEFKVLPEGLIESSFPIRRFKIKQIVLLVILVFLLLFGYIVFQYRYAIFSPPLNVATPQETAEISSQTLDVSGTTDPASTIFVDGEQVSVNSDGTFKKEIVVFPGKTIITIKAVNRFGKQTIIKRHVVVK